VSASSSSATSRFRTHSVCVDSDRTVHSLSTHGGWSFPGFLSPTLSLQTVLTLFARELDPLFPHRIHPHEFSPSSLHARRTRPRSASRSPGFFALSSFILRFLKSLPQPSPGSIRFFSPEASGARSPRVSGAKGSEILTLPVAIPFLPRFFSFTWKTGYSAVDPPWHQTPPRTH